MVVDLPSGTCLLAFSEGNIGAGATANPEYSLSSASAPADSKLKRQTFQRIRVALFVVHGCMSRFRRQLFASCNQYHGTRDRLSISGRVGNNGSAHSAPTMSPVPARQRACRPRKTGVQHFATSGGMIATDPRIGVPGHKRSFLNACYRAAYRCIDDVPSSFEMPNFSKNGFTSRATAQIGKSGAGPISFGWPFLLVALTVSGCVGISSVREGKANVVGGGVEVRDQRYVGEMFVLDGIDIRIEPLNRKSKNLSIFPVPMFESESKRKYAEFSVSVAVRATRPDVRFDPYEILYRTKVGDEGVHPTKLVGPYPCSGNARRPEAIQLPSGPNLLLANNTYCMWLYFAIEPPDPRQRFYFSLPSLQVQGEQIALPEIEFSESARRESFAVP